MSDKLTKTLIGALIAVALAIAVSYGLVSQQTADKIQADANQALSDRQTASPQSAPPAPQNPNSQAPAPTGPASQNATPAPRQ